MATATKNRSKMYPTRIDLPESTRVEIIDLLNKSVAVTLDLWTQVKHAHWNVKGKNFYQLHLLFDELAEGLVKHIDTLAERAAALGGVAMGTARMAASNTMLPEYPSDAVNGEEHLTALADRYKIFCKHLRNAIERTDELDDKDTNDIYIEVSREADMRLWFIEAHLQGH